jgi:hypothetical protein
MPHTYALILAGVIVNTVLANPTDPQNPAYIWVDISGYMPMPGIGWTTSDNVNFTPPGGA